eukprot:CAMPEP_0119005276 /NCGR_PEP_ID=MMETSP1176-20130426/1627_1 /TAXON_ID=265551 /ORGANISM="Synedropsis recta cf, Strain CCMP1620" /LENGTH=74 /DNA_ID=CAMNT_0006957065 /DNA_START=210 /DNA_END=434 /DNA_ORIENTATION=-
MGCRSSTLLHLDDSLKVGLKRVKKPFQGEQEPEDQGFVPSSKHPSVKLKKQGSSALENTPAPGQSDTDKEESGQ